jgi:hypothetical protein
MSSKNFGFLTKLKSKSFDKILTNNNNITTSYQYIDNFDVVSEEDCIKLDNINREIYKKNMELFDSINKKIEYKNAMFKIDNPPLPPSNPNNHEKYISYKLRNIENNVRYQSFAVCYLLNKGYHIYFDKIDNKTELDFEPHDAIEFVQKLENMTIENIMKNKKYEFYLSNGELKSDNHVEKIFNKKSNNINIQHISSSSSDYNRYSELSSSAPNLYPNIDYYDDYNIKASAPPVFVEVVKNEQVNRNIIMAPPASHYIVKNN